MIATLLSQLSGVGCIDSGADHMLLDQFFAASRLLDRTALARFATVVFDPSRDGTVTRFVVVSASDTQASGSLPPSTNTQTVRLLELSLADRVETGARPTGSVTMATRHVGVEATVRSPSGSLSRRRLDVTLQRARVADASRRWGRWVVTGVAERK